MSFREKLRHHTIITFLRKDQASGKSTGWHWGGVRHDAQRFVGKTVRVPHFNPDTVEYPSRERDESKPGIKTLLPFLKKKKKKNITEESELEDFEDLIVALDACYSLHKAISISSSRFGEDRRSDFSRLRGDFLKGSYQRWQREQKGLNYVFIPLSKVFPGAGIFLFPCKQPFKWSKTRGNDFVCFMVISVLY